MLFSTPLFLFGFFPLFFTLYWLVPARTVWLLLGSLFFYAWGEPEFLWVVLAASLLDWRIGQQIVRAPAQSRAARGWLALGVGSNLLILTYAKYTPFLIQNFNDLLGMLGVSPCTVPQMQVPLGVSFFVFEEITYLTDLYRGVALPPSGFKDYLNYLLFFPKMLAGPIVKYHDISAQLKSPQSTYSGARDGLLRFIQGLARKVLIADTLAPVADQVFALPAYTLDSSAAWLGLICFSLQIYFDFSGYSDMAIGMAQMMGFRLHENFRDPYLADSVTDFWRRWHISLSTWIREYLYIPLGGNRLGGWRRYLNLCFCFLLSGLWHGASWTFVVWGCFHGFGLIFDRAVWLKLQPRIPRLLRVLLTDAWVALSWVFFRCQTLPQAGTFLMALGGASPLHANAVFWRSDILFVILLGVVLILIPQRSSTKVHDSRPLALLWAMLLLILSVARMLVNGYHPFIYFRF